jgi:hypothetical protein
MPQAQVGKTKSMPKVVRVNAADGEAVLYRNLGNGRRLPFMWGTDVALASGVTEVVISSGVSFNDHKVSEGIVIVTPTNSDSAGKEYYVSKDTNTNKVSLVVNTNTTDLAFDVMIMLGVGYDFLNTHSNQIWK